MTRWDVHAGLCPVDSGSLAYEMRGCGPPLVLLHGFSFDRRAWDAQMDELAATHRVIRYDLRGFGQSSLPVNSYSHSDDLKALLHHLGIEQPILLGLSLGAAVALEYSLRFPESVSAQILASPGLTGHQWSDERPPDAAAAHAKQHGIESAKRFWLAHPVFASLRRRPAAFTRLRTMVDEYSGWHWKNKNPITTTAVADALGVCRVPTLVISGNLDVPGYRAIANRIVCEVPGAQLTCIAHAGHVINDDTDGEFLVRVREFTEKITITRTREI